MADLEGQTLGGYEVVAKIGHGGMGAVYMARDPRLNRTVALKILPPEFATDADYVQRFQREAVAAGQLNHTGIVQVYTTGVSDGVRFIAMELVEGESVQGRLKRAGPLEPREAIAIVTHVAQALAYAWSKARLIHRDIKPANIFLSNTGEVKLGDLGLAKTLEGSSAGMTATGAVLGTPHYISPEQARSAKDVDFRSDIYSLGCTLFHMLTGQPPYPGSDPVMVVHKHIHEPAPAIFKVLHGCPMPLGMLVGKMLAKSPHDRHQGYEELIADLKRVHELLVQPAPSAPVSPTTQAVAAPAKKPMTMIYAGAAAVAAVALVGGLLLWAPWKERGASSVEREASQTPTVAADVSPRTLPTERPAAHETKPVAQSATTASTDSRPQPPKASAVPPPDASRSTLNAPRPVDSVFIAAVASLDPADQVSRVMDKLLLLNPKFDGKQTHKIAPVGQTLLSGQSTTNLAVTELAFSTAEVSDISPLKALPHLQSLTIGGTAAKRALSDLSPLKGLKLAKLAIHFTAVSDLSPLEGMPLASLQMSNTRVSDLAPLKGAPLTWLSCVDAPVKDLAPLAGAPLATLWCGGSQVTDFSPLRAAPLKELCCDF